MKLNDVVSLKEIASGGPGSGRRPEGVSQRAHSMITDYGYKHQGDREYGLGGKLKVALYKHPEGHEVEVDKKGKEEFKITENRPQDKNQFMHPDIVQVNTRDHYGRGPVTLAGKLESIHGPNPKGALNYNWKRK
jgi:hypothetical protein